MVGGLRHDEGHGRELPVPRRRHRQRRATGRVEASHQFDLEPPPSGVGVMRSSRLAAGIRRGTPTALAAVVALAVGLVVPAPYAAAEEAPPQPVLTLTAPPAPLSGTVDLMAAATLAPNAPTLSGVTFEVAQTGTTAWELIATDTEAPYSARFDTDRFAGSTVDLRARATDATGQITLSSIETRAVSALPSAPSVALLDPGPVLSGEVVLGAEARAEEPRTIISV